MPCGRTVRVLQELSPDRKRYWSIAATRLEAPATCRTDAWESNVQVLRLRGQACAKPVMSSASTPPPGGLQNPPGGSKPAVATLVTDQTFQECVESFHEPGKKKDLAQFVRDLEGMGRDMPRYLGNLMVRAGTRKPKNLLEYALRKGILDYRQFRIVQTESTVSLERRPAHDFAAALAQRAADAAAAVAKVPAPSPRSSLPLSSSSLSSSSLSSSSLPSFSFPRPLLPRPSLPPLSSKMWLGFAKKTFQAIEAVPENDEIARASAAAMGVRERLRKIRELQERGNSGLMLTPWHGDDESTKAPGRVGADQSQILGKAPVPFSYGLARRWIEDAVRGLEFDDLQRAAFPGHLHRMAVEYNRQKEATQLSMRVARVVQGPAMVFPDLLIQNRSILIAAPPARGKTTLLRDFVRVLQELAPDRKIILVDRSDEIGGAADVPHKCLGSNVQVLRLRGQPCATVMARAFRNHSAEVVIVDEIGGTDEADMVMDLKSRGVTVIATCHGGLAEVLKSKALGRLLGGITSSTIGDEQAQSLVEFNKKHDEREGDSVFDTVVEIAALRRWVIHHDVDAAIHACLEHGEGYVEIREMDDSGALWTQKANHDFAGSAGPDMRNVNS
ncbi:hypothetical protein BDZ88DRAFT_506416 [Geranomyces variabilis]|nr:hypothetical protein BDZ88DRAFT_506416 [Geranomyces variabilis]KAJ3137517.1 hypothetical protein HDU90_001920 [Geranomyces variabilis]